MQKKALDVRATTSIDDCRRLWERTIPVEQVSDLWAFRECFHRHFDSPPLFLTVEEGDHFGLLPLSAGPDGDSCVYFPGELWKGRTWIELNRLPISSEAALDRLIEASAAPIDLRYLVPAAAVNRALDVDEIDYLFVPSDYGHSFERYLAQLSSKRFKSSEGDLELLGAATSYRYDVASDYETMVAMNLRTFGADSYFSDPRFRAAFDDLVALLRERGWLRLTTALIDGKPAAIDVGCVYRGTYTLLAGATDDRFLGVAKLINLHHIEWACRQRLACVDFMSGDFQWKNLFNLSPRPLHQIVLPRGAG